MLRKYVLSKKTNNDITYLDRNYYIGMANKFVGNTLSNQEVVI